MLGIFSVNQLDLSVKIVESNLYIEKLKNKLFFTTLKTRLRIIKRNKTNI